MGYRLWIRGYFEASYRNAHDDLIKMQYIELQVLFKSGHIDDLNSQSPILLYSQGYCF